MRTACPCACRSPGNDGRFPVCSGISAIRLNTTWSPPVFFQAAWKVPLGHEHAARVVVPDVEDHQRAAVIILGDIVEVVATAKPCIARKPFAN